MKTGIVFLCFVLLSIGLVASPGLAGQSYVLGDEDVLQVSVWGNPELTVEVPVRPDGRFVLGFVLAESILIAAVGGGIGLWLARGMAEEDITGGILPMYLSGQALAAGAAVALGTGLLAGLLPAVTAMRLSVVDALRRI